MVIIKLLTLNTHSLVEENYNIKLRTFTNTIAHEIPDIIALQEVNQTCDEESVNDINKNLLYGFTPCSKDIIIKKDNHAYNIIKLLNEKGISYYWTWLGMKKGYDKYDEGIALLSRSKILETDVALISSINDYNNWKTRKIIGIRTEKQPDTWFYSIHMGWWNDVDDPFKNQWERTDFYMKEHIKNNNTVWLMGDFNSPAGLRGEGYDMIKESGWFDSYSLATQKDSGITVETMIDGWKEKLDDIKGMRIDYIWCSKKAKVKSSNVIFNGDNETVVSDHYGVIVEI